MPFVTPAQRALSPANSSTHACGPLLLVRISPVGIALGAARPARGQQGGGEREEGGQKLTRDGSDDGNDGGESDDGEREDRGGCAGEGGEGSEGGGAPQARKLGKSQGRGCAWCAGQLEGASSGFSCALPLGRAIGGAFLPANTCPGERVLASRAAAVAPQSFHIHTKTRVPRWWPHGGVVWWPLGAGSPAAAAATAPCVARCDQVRRVVER